MLQQYMWRLSDETVEFFDFMVEKNLLDLDTKKNRGGYCTYIPELSVRHLFSLILMERHMM